MGDMMRPAATGSVAFALESDYHLLDEAIQSRDEWRFKLGQCVSHRDQPMPSLVLDRVRTSKGGEVYIVRSFANEDPARDRMMLAEVLVDVAPGSEPCSGCMLFRTGMCPGDLR